ncbi:MAG: substrate-binding domain-containing protein [Bacteroidota bacterium]
MKGIASKILVLSLVVGLGLSTIVALSAFAPKKKIKIGFLIHDLVSERWKMDMDNFANKVNELGGETILKNAYGDPQTQVSQGKMLIDEGIKVIVVVAQDGKVLAELVDYANKADAKIIAYDRMIIDCNLHYYISFNSIKVGELMADYALKLKPRGNYILWNGPSSDNNALLVRQGVMNKLKKSIDNGEVKVIIEKEIDAWYVLNSLMSMDEFLSSNTQPIDVVIASSDDLASGAIDAIKAAKLQMPVVTGQDATVDACKNIIVGNQSMTVFKSIKKLASEAAILAMKVAKGEKVTTMKSINNGSYEVPSILFDPMVVDKSNMRTTVIAEGQVKQSDL